MQSHCKTYFLQNNNVKENEEISDPKEFDVTNDYQPADIFGIAELVAGYMDCMEEALRYLKDVEQYAEDHPAVLGLQNHLAVYRKQLITDTIHSKENIPISRHKSRKQRNNGKKMR